MTRTLLTGLVTITGEQVAVEVDGPRLAWIGRPGELGRRGAPQGGLPGGPVVERFDGALITPGFVDAHVHATASGLLRAGLDLTECDGATEVLDALAAYARSATGTVVWGHGWAEDRTPGGRAPTRAEIDRAAPGRAVYLSRIDVHSALVSSALLDRASAARVAPGWSAEGALTADAHHHVRRAALAALDRSGRRAAQRAFLDHVATRGVVEVHECAGPDISGREDLADLLGMAGVEVGRVEVVGYWGEAVGTAAEARELCAATGAHGLAGDLFVDGSLGSRTAALREPYQDLPGSCGNTYLEPDTLAAHVAACTGARVQAGFHVIGDAAVEAAVAAIERAAELTSRAAVRAARHRLEHLEMVDAGQAARLASLGVVASVQPAFDAVWGGPSGMYAGRLGPERAAGMNPFAALRAAGVELAFGSDSPVTPVDPWAGIRAAVRHRTPGAGLGELAALAAHTVGGRHAARARGEEPRSIARPADALLPAEVADSTADALFPAEAADSTADCPSPRPDLPGLVPGGPATYCLWDGMPGASPRCLRTVRNGRTLHEDLP